MSSCTAYTPIEPTSDSGAATISEQADRAQYAADAPRYCTWPMTGFFALAFSTCP